MGGRGRGSALGGVCIQEGFESRRVGLGRSPFGYYGIWSTRRRTTGMRSCFYHLQRSWGKVMFLHVSVILFTGGVCLSACWDTPPPGTGLPREQTPRSSACSEIRATSGRYASCYNAYLFFFSIFSSARYLYLPVYICWPRRLEIGTLTVRRRIALRSRCSDEVCNE